MKYSEIIEWEDIHAGEYTIGDFPHAQKVGVVKTSLGDLPVFRADDGAYRSYLIKNGDSWIAILTLEQWGVGYCQTVTAYCSIPGKGIATSLVEWVIFHENTSLLSDFKMSRAGAALWQGLGKSSRIHLQIADVYGGETYDLSQVGEKTPDGETILHPRNDKRPENMKAFRLGVNQRFLFLASPHKVLSESQLWRGPFGGPGMAYWRRDLALWDSGP